MPFSRVFPRRASWTWETLLLPPLPKWLPQVPFSCPPVSQGLMHTASQTLYHPIFQKNLTKLVCRVRSTGEETGPRQGSHLPRVSWIVNGVWDWNPHGSNSTILAHRRRPSLILVFLERATRYRPCTPPTRDRIGHILRHATPGQML